jgi:hypothetical protein
MAATYTTTDFLASVRLRGSIPTTTNTNNVNNTSNLLSLATEELHIKLLPLIMAAREEFYVRSKDHTIVAGTASYAIPSRGTGMVLRDVQLIQGTSVRSLPMVDPEQVATTSNGEVRGYYLEHNNVVLYQTPASAVGTLRLKYFLRPGRLVATSSCAQISAIDTVTSTVTIASLPSGWTTGTVVDFVRATAPYDNPAIDQTITGTSSTSITFASLPTGLAVGDWVALAEYSPIPQIPHEFQPVLAQMTVHKVLEAQGDREGAAQAWKDLQTIQQYALQMITPRNQGEPKKVVARRWVS